MFHHSQKVWITAIACDPHRKVKLSSEYPKVMLKKIDIFRLEIEKNYQKCISLVRYGYWSSELSPIHLLFLKKFMRYHMLYFHRDVRNTLILVRHSGRF